MSTEDTIAETLTTVQKHVSEILSIASMRILLATQADENIGIRVLSQDIAKERGLDQNFVYGVLGAYIDTNPDLICVKGNGMGIMLRSKYDALQQKKEETRMEKTYSKFTVSVRKLGFKDKAQFNAAQRELGENPTLATLKGWLSAREAKLGPQHQS